MLRVSGRASGVNFVQDCFDAVVVCPVVPDLPARCWATPVSRVFFEVDPWLDLGFGNEVDEEGLAIPFVGPDGGMECSTDTRRGRNSGESGETVRFDAVQVVIEDHFSVG